MSAGRADRTRLDCKGLKMHPYSSPSIVRFWSTIRQTHDRPSCFNRLRSSLEPPPHSSSHIRCSFAFRDLLVVAIGMLLRVP